MLMWYSHSTTKTIVCRHISKYKGLDSLPYYCKVSCIILIINDSIKSIIHLIRPRTHHIQNCSESKWISESLSICCINIFQLIQDNISFISIHSTILYSIIKRLLNKCILRCSYCMICYINSILNSSTIFGIYIESITSSIDLLKSLKEVSSILIISKVSSSKLNNLRSSKYTIPEVVLQSMHRVLSIHRFYDILSFFLRYIIILSILFSIMVSKILYTSKLMKHFSHAVIIKRELLYKLHKKSVHQSTLSLSRSRINSTSKCSSNKFVKSINISFFSILNSSILESHTCLIIHQSIQLREELELITILVKTLNLFKSRFISNSIILSSSISIINHLDSSHLLLYQLSEERKHLVFESTLLSIIYKSTHSNIHRCRRVREYREVIVS